MSDHFSWIHLDKAMTDMCVMTYLFLFSMILNKILGEFGLLVRQNRFVSCISGGIWCDFFVTCYILNIHQINSTLMIKVVSQSQSATNRLKNVMTLGIICVFPHLELSLLDVIVRPLIGDILTAIIFIMIWMVTRYVINHNVLILTNVYIETHSRP